MPAAMWGRGFGRQWSPWGAAPCPWARCHLVPPRQGEPGRNIPSSVGRGFLPSQMPNPWKTASSGCPGCAPNPGPLRLAEGAGGGTQPRGEARLLAGCCRLGRASRPSSPRVGRPLPRPEPCGERCPAASSALPVSDSRGAAPAGLQGGQGAAMCHGRPRLTVPLMRPGPSSSSRGRRLGCATVFWGHEGACRAARAPDGGQEGANAAAELRAQLCVVAVPQPILPSVRHPLPSPSPVGLRASFWGGRNPPSPRGTGHPRAALRPGALCALAQRSQEMGLPFPSSPQLFLPGRESPKASLAHYIAAHLLLPSTNKRTSLVIYLFSPLSHPPPTGFEQPEADPGSNGGCRRGAAPLQFHLVCGGAAASDTAAERLSLELPPRTLPLMDHAIFFSLLFTLYCSCFCTGKRCWSAQKSFRSRLAAELCLIIVIIWKQVMGIFPMLI